MQAHAAARRVPSEVMPLRGVSKVKKHAAARPLRGGGEGRYAPLRGMREGEVTPLRGVWEVKEHAAARRERSADTRRCAACEEVKTHAAARRVSCAA